MRRAATWLAVAAVSALTAAAVLDAVRSPSRGAEVVTPKAPPLSTSDQDPSVEREPRFVALARAGSPGELSERSFAAGLLTAAGLSGRLYLSDEKCRLRGYSLPTLEVQAMPDTPSCTFSVSDDGWLAPEEVAWQPAGSLAARCRAGWVDIVTRAGDPYQRFRGCAPSWSPDGELAYVLDGDVRRWPGGELVLSGDDLDRALRDGGASHASGGAIEHAVWLKEGILAVVVRRASLAGSRPTESVIAAYDLGRRSAAVLARAPEITGVAASPNGHYLAARIGSTVRVLTVDGPAPRSDIALRSAEIRSFAWSPDGRWLAVGAGATLTFVPVGQGNDAERPRLAPIVANDLAWR